MFWLGLSDFVFYDGKSNREKVKCLFCGVNVMK